MARMDCCNGSMFVNLDHLYSLHRWHHFCLALDLTTRSVVTVHSGKVKNDIYLFLLFYVKLIRLQFYECTCLSCWSLVKSILILLNTTQVQEYAPPVDETKIKAGQGLRVAEGQRAVVGQDLDSLEGDFSMTQNFNGLIADFRFYNKVLSLEAMIAFTTCAADFKEDPKPLLTIDNGKLKATGSVTVKSISKSKLCENQTEYVILFPIKTSYQNSFDTCKRLKGTLALPYNPEVNKQLHGRFSKLGTQCNSQNSLRFWIGAKLNTTLRQWVDVSHGRPLSWHNFGTIPFDPWMKCVAVGSRRSPYIWNNNGCEEYIQECFACNFTTWPQIRIRGLCKHSLFDRKLYLNDYDNDLLQFDGEHHSYIVRRNGQWVMESSTNKKLKATMLSLTDDVSPLGRHTWEVQGDRCNNTKVSHSFDCSSITGNGLFLPSVQEKDSSNLIISLSCCVYCVLFRIIN